MQVVKISRRGALQLGLSAATGGLLLGCATPRTTPRFGATPPAPAKLNAWVSIAPDGIITLITPGAELGQGVYTSLPMILAEDMEADFANVRVAPFVAMTHDTTTRSRAIRRPDRVLRCAATTHCSGV